MNNLEVTNVSVYPVKNSEGKLRGIARVQLNDCLQLTNLRIYEGSNGLFVSYPIEFTKKGEEFRQIFYPTKKELREHIEVEVLAKYELTLQEVA